MNNIYKKWAPEYLKKHYSVIPDKYGKKTPAIKGWSSYCERMPDSSEVEQWSGIGDTNIALCTGKASGIIALDFDATDQKIIDAIEPLLPPSPVERIGMKGWARFFRYNGEVSQAIKNNGQVVFEILSDNKKVTLPPSLHPSQVNYKWSSNSLLDVDKSNLPFLPPTLLAHVGSKLRLQFPEAQIKGNKIINGRNDGLSSLCGSLIKEGVPVDEAIRRLIEFDEQNHDSPLFRDINEMSHGEPFTNALTFYSNHLQTVNSRRLRERKEYEVPITASAVNHEYKEEVLKKKEQKTDQLKKVKESLPKPMGIIAKIQDLILSNSFIKQEELAFSAALALMATAIGRKLTFLNNAPNLYLLNVAPSGSGKDMPQQVVKQILINIGAEHLLGAGDYVSDASLMDSLGHQPVRLDLVDEASGLLKSVDRSGQDYSSKMADILCELYTTSNSKFLGRQLAEERKGVCFRPNVNMLMSTTPRGFEEGISVKAIEKGLMGRVLVFQGDSKNRAERVNKFNELDNDTINKLKYWIGYKPSSTDKMLGDVSQVVDEVKADAQANARLDEIFEEFDELRRNEDNDSLKLPIIARMFQQLCKLALIHAASRTYNQDLIIKKEDIEFAYKTIKYNYEQFSEVLGTSIHHSGFDRDRKKILKYVEERGTVTKRQLSNNFRRLRARERDEILNELLDNGEICVINIVEDGKPLVGYMLGE